MKALLSIVFFVMAGSAAVAWAENHNQGGNSGHPTDDSVKAVTGFSCTAPLTRAASLLYSVFRSSRVSAGRISFESKGDTVNVTSTDEDGKQEKVTLSRNSGARMADGWVEYSGELPPTKILFGAIDSYHPRTLDLHFDSNGKVIEGQYYAVGGSHGDPIKSFECP